MVLSVFWFSLSLKRDFLSIIDGATLFMAENRCFQSRNIHLGGNDVNARFEYNITFFFAVEAVKTFRRADVEEKWRENVTLRISWKNVFRMAEWNELTHYEFVPLALLKCLVQQRSINASNRLQLGYNSCVYTI